MSAYGAPVSQSTGIQQLLAAEKRAAEKVSEARKRKLNICIEFGGYSAYDRLEIAIEYHDSATPILLLAWESVSLSVSYII